MQAEEPVWLSAPLQALPATNIKLLLHPTYLTQGSAKAFAVSRQRTWRGADYRHALPPPTPLFESESPHWAQAEAALARLPTLPRSLAFRRDEF